MRYLSIAYHTSRVILLLFSAWWSTTHCMLEKWNYEPLMQPHDAKITRMRNQLCATIIKTNPNVVQKKATPDEREERCFYFAIKATTGFAQPLNFWPGIDFFSSIMIENYFDQTTTPQPRDLAVYTKSKDNLSIMHFAVVKEIIQNKIILQSKWGSIDATLEHGPFDVPIWYGNALGFFTLKNKYKTLSNKEFLHAAMTAEKNRNDLKISITSSGTLILMTLGFFFYVF